MEEISLCMIVKDEEKHLESCLDSVKGLADEIIIVDTGSVDNSRKIAERFTDKVFSFKWGQDFSKARNFSISKATKSWILVLDADEAISEKDKEKIKELVKSGKADAFVLKCRNYTHNLGTAGWIPSNTQEYEESRCAPGFWVLETIRLFKNKKAFFFEGSIHETVYNSLNRSGGQVLDTDAVIHHFGELDKEKLSSKKNSYVQMLESRLERKDFSEKSGDYIYYELAGELIKLKEIDKAIACLENAVKLKEEFNYLLQLGGLYILKKRLDDAERALKKAVAINSSNSSAHNNLGVVYSEKGEYSKAIRKFERAIQLNPESADACFNLALVYKKKGKVSKAAEFFEKAVDLNPEYKKKLGA